MKNTYRRGSDSKGRNVRHGGDRDGHTGVFQRPGHAFWNRQLSLLVGQII